MKQMLPCIALTLALPAVAGENRELDAHEHGVGELNIAIDGNQIAMELHAPGADIVGFEHAAESAQDRAAIETAVATLARPLALFGLPADAECTVTQASAELESEEHDEHEGADDHDHEHDHDDHADHDDHDDHADHGDGHDHDEHAEDDHEGEATHSEFHAAYMFDCARPDAITEIEFTYFDVFENARELEIQVVGASGAKAFDVDREAPSLDLRGMF